MTRTNAATNPAATVNGVSGNTVGWSPRWFGGGGAGTTAVIVGATDGPIASLTTYLRKTWTAPAQTGDTGYSHTVGDGTTPVAVGGMPVSPGQVWAFSSWLRALSATPKTGRIKLYWRDAAGAFLSSTIPPSASLALDQWHRVTLIATVPAGAAFVGFNSDVNGAGTWQVGDHLDGTGLLAERVAAVDDYFDGSTPDVPPTTTVEGIEYAWTGPANASTSTATPIPVVPRERYMPTITIAGLDVPSSWTDASPVVLDTVTQEWGRDELYDPNEPGRLSVDIIDPDGSFVADPALFSGTIRMSIPGIGIAFAGWIDQCDITRVAYTRADGTRAIGWRGRITATDAIGALAKITGPGGEVSSTYGSWYWYWRSIFDQGWWGFNLGNSARVAQINDRLAAAALTVRVVSPTGGTPPGGSIWFPNKSSGDSYYQLIIGAYARAPLFPSDARYNPDTDQVFPGRLAAPASLRLVYLASVITAASTDPTARSVAASTVEIDPGAAISSALSHNITSIRVSSFLTNAAGTQPFTAPGYVETHFAVPPTSGTAMDTPIPGTVGFNQWDTQAEIEWEAARDDENPTEFAAKLRPIVQALNGRLYSPPLTFNLDRFDYAPEVITELLRGYGSDSAWTFPGSMFEGLRGYGPFFQMVGATAVYADDAWKITGSFAPARSTGAGGIPINALVTIPEPTFDQFDPSITLATLGTVSEGI